MGCGNWHVQRAGCVDVSIHTINIQMQIIHSIRTEGWNELRTIPGATRNGIYTQGTKNTW